MTAIQDEGAPWFCSALTDARGAGTVLILSRGDVVRCLSDLDAVTVVRDTLAAHDDGRCVLPGEAYLPWRNTADAYTRSIAMPGAVVAFDGPGQYGLKVINASVTNPSIGLERAGGVGLCFDPETARITAIIEIGLISALRTAAVSAVGVDEIGYRDAESLSVVGCGMQGRMHLALLAERLHALRRITVFDHDPAVAQRMRDVRPDIETVVVDNIATAVRAGRIVLFATTADEGYVPPEWVAPGALLVNVSLADLMDATLLGAAALYVDDVDLIRENPRRPLGRLLLSGAVGEPGAGGDSPQRIGGTIGGLITGRYQPVTAEDSYAVLNPFGMGVLDVALLTAVREAAVAAGIGQDLVLG